MEKKKKKNLPIFPTRLVVSEEVCARPLAVNFLVSGVEPTQTQQRNLVRGGEEGRINCRSGGEGGSRNYRRNADEEGKRRVFKGPNFRGR